ncbi:TolC family protein [Haliea sp. E1-2-M8]|uniref:TolC family protein n=1 Tax=Haliea sp. E1-2-M8 TaxID=3064706 RepID=UPI00271D6AE8|nr:TolC family protein [Haliea sp. E1-2-M8]MDO8862055.1 TolC family protein [Haliea sp. E1-2-M8]
MSLRDIDVQKIPTASRFYGRFLTPTYSVFFVGVACLLASTVNAQSVSQQTILSLDQAVHRTLEQHPQLGVFLHRREAYQGLVEQVGVGERPNVSVMVEDFGGNGDHNGLGGAQSTLSISWITQNARIDQRIQSARVAASQVDIEQEVTALDLSAQTARLFVQALVEEQRLTLAKKAIQQARDAVATIQKRVEVGKSPEFERLQAEVELAQRELEAEDLQHVLSSTRYQLAAQWGGERDGFRLEGELFKAPAVGSVDQQLARLKQNPALTLLATQKRIAESEIELARIEAKPQWQFSVGVRRFEATDDFGMIAGVSVPLGKDRSSAGKIRSLLAKQGEYDSESAALKRQLGTQLYVLLQEINHSQHVIQTLQEQIIPILSSAQAQAGQAYETGQLGYQQWTAILNKKLGAQQDLLSAFEAIHLQHIELQRLTGTTLTF